jgi:hypothetical protein
MVGEIDQTIFPSNANQYAAKASRIPAEINMNFALLRRN